MKTYLLDIIPKIQRFSQKLDDLTVLLNKHWVILDEETMNKTVFIFREKNNQLLISNNGVIEKGTWDYLGNNSLLIDRETGSYLFKHGFIDEYVLALKVDGKEEYALLLNEQWFDKQIKSLESILRFLNEKYLVQKPENEIPTLGGGLFPNYREDQPIEQKQIFGGTYYTIRIHFEKSFSDFYHFYPKKNNYSYQKNNKGEVFFSNKEDCLKDLYEDRLRYQ